MAGFIKENANTIRDAERLKAFGKQHETQPGLSNLASGKKKKKKTLMSGGKRPKTLIGGKR